MEIDDDSSEVKKHKDWVSNSGDMQNATNKEQSEQEEFEVEWGYKANKMTEDDTIYKLNYQ